MKDEYKRGLISVCIFVLIFFVFKLLVGVSAYDDGIEANFVSGEIGIVDTKGHIEFGAFIAILGSESCSANSIEQISVSPLSLFIPRAFR